MATDSNIAYTFGGYNHVILQPFLFSSDQSPILIPSLSHPKHVFLAQTHPTQTNTGGYWYENDRSDINNWKNNQVIEDAGISTDPKRVGQVCLRDENVKYLSQDVLLCCSWRTFSFSCSAIHCWHLYFVCHQCSRQCGHMFLAGDHVFLRLVLSLVLYVQVSCFIIENTSHENISHHVIIFICAAFEILNRILHCVYSIFVFTRWCGLLWWQQLHSWYLRDRQPMLKYHARWLLWKCKPHISQYLLHLHWTICQC